jgi:hypothetical protein
LVSPPVPNIIRRVFPYASLSDLKFLETEGYIAGVTNPMFQKMDSKWDLLVTLDLPNDTCTITTPEEKRNDETASSKAKTSDSRNRTRSYSTSNTSIEDSLKDFGLPIDLGILAFENVLNSHEQIDSNFYTNLVAGITVNNYNEIWCRNMFQQYTENIIQQAFDLKLEFFDYEFLDLIPEKQKKKILRSKNRNASAQSNNTKEKEKEVPSVNLNEDDTSTIQMSSEILDFTSSDTIVVDDKLNNIEKIVNYNFSDTIKKQLSGNNYRAKTLSGSRELLDMPNETWAWCSLPADCNIDLIHVRYMIRRLICEINLDTLSVIEIYDTINSVLSISKDDTVIESILISIISLFPLSNQKSDSCLSTFVCGLLHKHPKVRRLSFEILSMFKKFESLAYFFESLNKFYLIAYEKISLQIEDGSLLLEEEEYDVMMRSGY